MKIIKDYEYSVMPSALEFIIPYLFIPVLLDIQISRGFENQQLVKALGSDITKGGDF